ncbi:MAG TPA: Ig-like domain-containing protein [Planctomycetota bacterium]|jgi:hypothetical protein|nr:Ig-like domain-containing protein [Planctomycetota bacterium]
MVGLRRFGRVLVGVSLLPLGACGGGGGGGGSAGALLGAVQNRDVDAQGRSVDFSFDHRMRALQPADLAAFVASGGQQPVSATLLASEKDVRVVFDALALPGETTFEVSGLRDRSGKLVRPASAVALSSTDATPPPIDAAAATAVANAANDRLTISFGDDMVPADVVDPSHYVFEQPAGTPVPLGPDAFAYDAGSRTVTVLFDGTDAAPANLQFGQGWSLAVSGVRDLGGNAIAAGAAASGLVDGDAFGPALLGATQNMLADPSGATVDLAFDETVDAASAEIAGNYAGSVGQLALAATLLPPGDLVRVLFGAPVVPGADTISVQNVFDLAGNQMAAVSAAAIASTDALPPAIDSGSATTVSGYGNDLLAVVFSEPVFPSEATDPARYALESPQGSPLPLSGASFSYDGPSRTATILLAGSGALAVNLRTGASFLLSCSGVRDLAGNPLAPGASFAGVVGGDSVAPSIVSVSQNLALDPLGRVADVLFNEPISLGTSAAPFFAASEGQAFVGVSGLPGSMGIRLVFDDAVVPGSTTLTVSGVEDPAGNPGGGAGLAVATSDSTPPSLVSSRATAVPGSANDPVVVLFSEPVVPSDAETPAAYALESPIGTALPLAGASFAYDPAAREITITLPAGTNLQAGATYRISVAAVRDVAGNPMVPSASSGIVLGDSTPPTVLVADRNEVVDPSSRTVDVTFSESVEKSSAEAVSNYWFVAKGTPPVLVAAVLLGDGKTVRLTAGDTVIPGTHRLRVRDVRDLAGNPMPTTNGIEITP